MLQQFQRSEPGNSQNAWLAMLVDTMEQAAMPEWRAVPCDPPVLAALKLQLGLPAVPYLYGSPFSFRN
jgi:hypothetical protein